MKTKVRVGLTIGIFFAALVDLFRQSTRIVGVVDNTTDGFNIKLMDSRGIYWLSAPSVRGVHFIRTKFFLTGIPIILKIYRF